MYNKSIKLLLINKNSSIKEAIKTIDRGSLGIAFIIDKNNKLFGVVTDGDIRRAILGGINIKNSIVDIANKNPITIKSENIKKEILYLKGRKDVIKKRPSMGSLKIPVIDQMGRIKDIIFIYSDEQNKIKYFNQRPKFVKDGIKNIFITGGAGYLGSVLCRKLLAAGYNVRVLDNLTYGDEGIKELYKNPKFEFLKGDVRNISNVMEAAKGMDAVIHLSAIVGDGACQIDSKETIEINYLSAKAVAEACKFNQINKFLFASTCSVYGSNQTPRDRLKEDSPLNPVSLYAETKLKSEEGILSLADENFSPTIFRFATLYGVSPRMRFDLVVNLMTADAVTKNKIAVFGGNQWRPNLEVSDAAEACLKWVFSPIDKSGGQIFNVGSSQQNFKISEIGRMIQENISGTKIDHKKNESDLRDYNVSFDKILKILNFKTKKTIKAGILDIKKFIECKKIKDFNSPQYNNYRFLSNNKENINIK
ncbi:MAG: NAD-dependent epimerase/dehydratase family protein [Candidatus Staskawiczbacteria bacterium]|jgi:nucleoside-diphosphate-sugar epimerase/CBS domain-containing protein